MVKILVYLFTAGLISAITLSSIVIVDDVNLNYIKSSCSYLTDVQIEKPPLSFNYQCTGYSYIPSTMNKVSLIYPPNIPNFIVTNYDDCINWENKYMNQQQYTCYIKDPYKNYTKGYTDKGNIIMYYPILIISSFLFLSFTTL